MTSRLVPHVVRRAILGALFLGALGIVLGDARAARPPAAAQGTAGAPPVRVGRFDMDVRHVDGLAQGLPSLDVRSVAVENRRIVARTASGDARWDGTRWQPLEPGERPAADAEPSSPPGVTVVGRARAPDGRVALAAREGLFLHAAGGWSRLLPTDGRRSWAPIDVRAVAFDTRGLLWFASPQGIGRLDRAWRLWTAADGLPYDDPTSLAALPDGRVWIGTTRGAIRFDGERWEYRQGPRWLPDDHVRAVAADGQGQVFFATSLGVGRLVPTPTTLRDKARVFEAEIDRLHRRTPFGFVERARLPVPGDTRSGTLADSDNDGLWTSMYGAGQAFAFAATGDEGHRAKARAAFDAMRFLRLVTVGGTPPARPGFVARSVLPADGPDPNLTDSPEADLRKRERDRLWKVLRPRWPKSADGKWYWKSDTSSDELDGHFFFYAAYFDLVARDEPERARVREHVAAIADHLIAHDFQLVDHDGRPTRWGVFSPRALNHDPDWTDERGLNSTSILAYLRVAGHITGDPRYDAAARTLVEHHSYAKNTLIPKSVAGIGAGNQSDDEMAFMNLWCLLRYERDEALRRMFALAFHQRWLIERPEHSPLFHVLYASSVARLSWPTPFGEQPLDPEPGWLEEAVDALRRYPLDRVNWAFANGHRKDIVPLPLSIDGPGRGMRRDGRALPIDERFVDKWNHDPWRLDGNGDGRTLADGTSFLLPYYLARYAGFIAED